MLHTVGHSEFHLDLHSSIQYCLEDNPESFSLYIQSTFSACSDLLTNTHQFKLNTRKPKNVETFENKCYHIFNVFWMVYLNLLITLDFQGLIAHNFYKKLYNVLTLIKSNI